MSRFLPPKPRGLPGVQCQADMDSTLHFVAMTADMTARARRGFTLIELMVVVTIISVLAAISLPVYRDYAVRARVSEVILSTSTCRSVVSEAVQAAVQTDLSAVLAGSCTIEPSQYVAAGTVTADGKIVVESRNLGGDVLDNSTIKLVPLTADGELVGATAGGAKILTWRCSGGGNGQREVAARYLPASCKT